MKRNDITITLPSKLVGKKFKAIYNSYLKPDFSLRTALEQLSDESSDIEIWNYIEDDSMEIRKVTVIKFGTPTQLNINLYR